MEKHPNHLNINLSLDELARQIGNLSYDKTAEFIDYLAQDLKRQADADSQKQRKKLSSKLYNAVNELNNAKSSIDSAWQICKPYMNSESKF